MNAVGLRTYQADMKRTNAAASKHLPAALAAGLLGALQGVSAGPEPPRFTAGAPAPGAPLTFIAYGDTRFSDHEGIANPLARRALVEAIAHERPVAILIGGDLVYEGSRPDDYETFRRETAAWSEQKIPVFPALGNHEFLRCARDEPGPCLENWWQGVSPLPLRPFRWYSVAIGSTLLALLLDSTSSRKPGSE